MIQKIRKHTNSVAFVNALKITIAAVVPVVFFGWLGYFNVGLAIALGAFFAFPTDIPSSIKHKIKGLVVASLLFAGINILVNTIIPYPIIFYPFLTGLLFLASMLTVYGQRASMVSFSALLAISLSFAHIHEGWDILIYAGYTFVGGMFFLLVSLVFHYIQPHRYVETELATVIKLTAKYLKLRGDLWSPGANRQKIIEKQLNLQVEVNTIQENLRKVLFNTKVNSGISAQSKKMLIAFITLVEIQELALSTSFDHDKLQSYFKKNPEVLWAYQNLAYKLANKLNKLAKNVHKPVYSGLTNDINQALIKLEKGIEIYKNDPHVTNRTEGVLMLTNMSKYAKNQIEKIRIVDRAFAMEVKSFDFKERNNELNKFLTPQYYPIRTLIENLSFSSTLFRHSLRLTCTIMVGLIVSQFLPFQNVYWILMTIVVIMRPGYGLTKERSYHRIFGTVLGAIIAFGIISLVKSHTAISIIAIMCMLIGISFTQSNYKVGATFITMYVVFLYGIVTPNIYEVIQFRIVDTVVGAALAFFANYFLWPSWEFLNTKPFVTRSVEANRDYLKEIAVYYNNKGTVSLEYRLARKKAFIEIGNLMTSFQRMLQEPKSKQTLLPQINKLAVMNHSLLSATASLGTYIQSHETTSASDAFNFIADTVVKKLTISVAILKGEPFVFDAGKDAEALSLRFEELKRVREKLYADQNPQSESNSDDYRQEVQLVIEQLTWMNNLSDTILKVTKEFANGTHVK